MAKKGDLFLVRTESQKIACFVSNSSMDAPFLLILAVPLKTS